MKDLTNFSLPLLYERAKESLNRCLKGGDAELLANELPVRLDQIRGCPDSVRLTFYGVQANDYLLETKLLLVSDAGRGLGYYCVHENMNGEVIDDYLVFE